MFSTNNILDTLRLDSTGFFLKKFHVQRTFEAFQEIQNPISYEKVFQIYNLTESDLLSSYSEPKIIRMLFDKTSANYTVSEHELTILNQPVQLEINLKANQPTGLGLQNFKWENRTFWNDLLQKKSSASDDIISVNTEGHITETSRFNIFLYSKEKDLVFTPSLTSGCINGVYRRFVMDQKLIHLPNLGPTSIVEMPILSDRLFESQIFLANSVRSVVQANLNL